MVNRNGINVLVTRPAHQAEQICQLIQQAGDTALLFPVLEIQETARPETLNAILARLAEFDIAIFISANAVDYGLNAARAGAGFPTSLKVAAVGLATAKRLAEQQHPADIFPNQNFNSEALLELTPLREVHGKRIVIFRGEGGRELLASELQARGAHVEYAECYRRARPAISSDLIDKVWASGSVDIILVTSNEGLQNLFDIVTEQYRTRLLGTPLIVVSERAVSLARQLGFTSQIIVAATASDQAMMDALQAWKSASD